MCTVLLQGGPGAGPFITEQAGEVVPPALLRQGRQRLLCPHRHRAEQRRPPRLPGGRDPGGGGGLQNIPDGPVSDQQNTQAAPRPPGAHIQDGVRVQRALSGDRVPEVARRRHAGRHGGAHAEGEDIF